MQTEVLQTNGNGESRIRKILFNEISFVISVIGATLAVVLWLTGSLGKNDTTVELLKSQLTDTQGTLDKVTQTQQNDTKELRLVIEQYNAQVQQLSNDITELRTIINERIPSKK